MSYRQSVMYKLTTYLQDLPLQSVSSKKNLQVVDKFRKTCELFLCSKNKRGRSNTMHSFLCKVVYLEFTFMMAGRNYFRSFVEQIFTLSFQNAEFFL